MLISVLSASSVMRSDFTDWSHGVQISNAREHTQSNKRPNVESPLLLNHTPPTLPSLPSPASHSPLHRLLSDPSHRLWGGVVTKQQPSNWHPTLRTQGILHSLKRGIRVFRMTRAPLSWVCGPPQFCVCAHSCERENCVFVETWVFEIVKNVFFGSWGGTRCTWQPWCRSHQHLFLDPCLSARSVSETYHTKVLKHTIMYKLQARNNIYI